jgi:hypothetical protein
MNKIHQSIAVLGLVLVSLVGCNYEPRAAGNANPASVAEMQQNLRDLWVGHIFWVRHVVSNIATNDPEERDAAEKEVVTNTKQIAHTMVPFYGEVASEKFYSLLEGNIGAVREYSEATVAENKQYKAKDYAPIGATWPMMRQHIYVIADTLTTALVKQFPSKFS